MLKYNLIVGCDIISFLNNPFYKTQDGIYIQLTIILLDWVFGSTKSYIVNRDKDLYR